MKLIAATASTVLMLVMICGCGGYTRTATQGASETTEGDIESVEEDTLSDSELDPDPGGYEPMHLLEGTKWVLTGVNGQSIQLGLAGRPIYIELIPDGRRVVGYTGCNSIMSSYEIEEGTLRFGQIGATKIYCEGMMNIESEIIAALARVTNYTLIGNVLELSTGAELVASFVAAE